MLTRIVWQLFWLGTSSWDIAIAQERGPNVKYSNNLLNEQAKEEE